MNDWWERQLAADVAAARLSHECCKDPIVRNCMMHAQAGDVDLLTAFVECIKALVKARGGGAEEAHAQAARLNVAIEDEQMREMIAEHEMRESFFGEDLICAGDDGPPFLADRMT